MKAWWQSAAAVAVLCAPLAYSDELEDCSRIKQLWGGDQDNGEYISGCSVSYTWGGEIKRVGLTAITDSLPRSKGRHCMRLIQIAQRVAGRKEIDVRVVVRDYDEDDWFYSEVLCKLNLG